MTFIFRNHWRRKLFSFFILIMAESFVMTTRYRSRRVTYIGLLNFLLIIKGKSVELKKEV
jgi:hypothetical protein